MNPSLSYRIREKAQSLGFQKVGISEAVPTPNERVNLEKWLNNGYHGTMEWMEKRKDDRGDIHTYFPDAKSVISVGLNYYTGFNQEDLTSNFKFSNYAWGDDYHEVLKSKLFSLYGWLKSQDKDANGIVCVDTSPVMEKVWAQKAGIGWIGKHTNLISRDYGSWLFLGELILNIDLDPDRPFVEDLCGSCTACIDACPTEAIGEYQLYSEKCISYLTIEHRGEFSAESEELHGWIYGCDICQEVCPWNQKFSRASRDQEFKPREKIMYWKDEDWCNLDENEFRKLFKKSSVKRTKFSGISRNINQNKKILG